MTGKALATRAVRGVFWTGGAVAVQLVITFVFYRFLPVEEMGQFNWALTVVMLCALVSAMGLGEALVQFQDADDTHFSSAFWGCLVCGLLMTGLLMLGAPLISGWAEDPLAFRKAFVPLTLLVPFAAVSGIFRARLSRELCFREIAFSEVTAVGVASLVAVGVLTAGYGIWGPILNAIAREAVLLGGLWWMAAWRPRMIFCSKPLSALLSFGLNVTGANTLNYLNSNLDKLFVFYFLGDKALGFYGFAYRFTMMPLTRAAMVITRVSFPTFARIQADNTLLRRGYLKAVEGISLLSWPAMAGALIFAPEILQWVKGQEMMGALNPLRLLILAGMVKAIGTVVGSVFLARGKATWSFRWTVFHLIVIVPALSYGVRFGVTGIAVVISLATVFFIVVTQFLVNRLTGLTYGQCFGSLGRPVLVMLLVLAILLPIRFWVNATPLATLFFAVLIGVAGYVLGLRLLAWTSVRAFWQGFRGKGLSDDISVEG